MFNKRIIKKANPSETQEHKMCFYCDCCFCVGYHHPHSRMVCSGILPKWYWLWFLMREISANYTCEKFRLHQVVKQNPHKR